MNRARARGKDARALEGAAPARRTATGAAHTSTTAGRTDRPRRSRPAHTTTVRHCPSQRPGRPQNPCPRQATAGRQTRQPARATRPSLC
eukprot:2665965-Rhodomonas_salina.1